MNRFLSIAGRVALIWVTLALAAFTFPSVLSVALLAAAVFLALQPAVNWARAR